jgi:hypothetical protein
LREIGFRIVCVNFPLFCLLILGRTVVSSKWNKNLLAPQKVLFMTVKTLLASCLLFVLFVSLADERPVWQGTIMPAYEELPEFVQRQWKDVVTNAQFPLPKKKWQAVGLPPGLEKQVWDAWTPGAKRVWHSIGPGYLNVILDAKIDNGLISMLVDLGGLFQSRDGGNSWYPLSHHLTQRPFHTFDISPANPDIIAVGGVHIDRSLNRGRSWSPVFDQALPPFKAMRVSPGGPLSGLMNYGQIRFNANGSRVFALAGQVVHSIHKHKKEELEIGSWLKRKYVFIGDGEVANFKAVDLGSDFAGVRALLPHFSDPDLVYISFFDGSIYVCRNATDDSPVFTELARPEWMDGLQALSMDVSPDDPNTLLLALAEQSEKKRQSKLVLAKVVGSRLEAREIAVKGTVRSVRWNPHNRKQVFVVGSAVLGAQISDDNLESFREVEIPSDFFPAEHSTGYLPGTMRMLAFDRKSDLAALASATGAWLSQDQFASVRDAVMTHDTEKNLFGNKGVAYPECVVSVCIRKQHTYFATADHGSWRSDGGDNAKWRKISDNTGMPTPDRYRLAFPMGVSEDEKFIYLAARMNNWLPGVKLMLSKDQGDSWLDVTERLGHGGVLDKKTIRYIFFDPNDSNIQWIFSESPASMFLSTDGGESFKEVDLAIQRLLRGIAYDPLHKVIYIGTPNGLSRSPDLGLTWDKIFSDVGISVYNVGVLSNGDLVFSDNGRLVVVPYDKIDAGQVEQAMIRMTIGDDIAAAARSQRTFSPIVCDGMSILAIPACGWNDSNAKRDLGALLSRDGGSSFQWITHDLPCWKASDNPFSAALRGNKVILGVRGIHECDLDTLGLPVKNTVKTEFQP